MMSCFSTGAMPEKQPLGKFWDAVVPDVETTHVFTEQIEDGTFDALNLIRATQSLRKRYLPFVHVTPAIESLRAPCFTAVSRAQETKTRNPEKVARVRLADAVGEFEL